LRRYAKRNLELFLAFACSAPTRDDFLGTAINVYRTVRSQENTRAKASPAWAREFAEALAKLERVATHFGFFATFKFFRIGVKTGRSPFSTNVLRKVKSQRRRFRKLESCNARWKLRIAKGIYELAAAPRRRSRLPEHAKVRCNCGRKQPPDRSNSHSVGVKAAFIRCSESLFLSSPRGSYDLLFRRWWNRRAKPQGLKQLPAVESLPAPTDYKSGPKARI